MRIKWHLEKRKMNELTPHPNNPRIIDDHALSILKESFDEIGVAQPINISRSGVILSGHARYMQLQKDGVDEVDVLVPDQDLTEKQEEAVIIRMNKNVVGAWDLVKLKDYFKKDDLFEWGFKKFELLDVESNEPHEEIEEEEKEESPIHKFIVTCDKEDKDAVFVYIAEHLNKSQFKNLRIK